MARSLACALAALLITASSASASVAGPFTRTGKWLTDAQGRVVQLHGVNIVRKTGPMYPDNFSAQDASFLAGEGFTVARIGFIWAGVEPKPGVYDDAYIKKFIALNQLLARHGIKTLVDFHQDAWNDGNGQGGAPAWATLGAHFLDSFQAFWDNQPASDGVGIQTHFARAWGHVAKLLDAAPGADNVIGLDPFNEPYAGTKSACAPFTPCPSFESGPLADFYRGVIAAIRATGDRHVIYPEGIAQNGLMQPTLPKFDDAQTAFTFHYYCPLTQMATSSNPWDVACGPHRDYGIGNFTDYTDALNVPGFEGEFSCNDADDDNASTVDLFGEDFLSWTIWSYYAYKQDPANCGGQGLVVDETKPASASNVKQSKLDAIVVPYAAAIAGTPKSSAFDRATNTMTLSYTAQGAKARTEIFAPARKYPKGYTASVKGGRVVSKPGATWLEVLADRSGDAVSVTLAPKT